MGAEALCRDAAMVVGIERSSAACTTIDQNWLKVTGDSQKFQLLRGDVVQRLADLNGQKFDRIYFDPPYAGGLYQPVLAAIDRDRLLAQEGGSVMRTLSPVPVPATLRVVARGAAW